MVLAFQMSPKYYQCATADGDQSEYVSRGNCTTYARRLAILTFWAMCALTAAFKSKITTSTSSGLTGSSRRNDALTRCAQGVYMQVL